MDKMVSSVSKEEKETTCKICHKHFSAPLDLQEHIKLNHQIKTTTSEKSGIDNKQLEKAIKEAKAIKAKNGTFYDFSKKWALAWSIPETKVMDFITPHLGGS